MYRWDLWAVLRRSIYSSDRRAGVEMSHMQRSRVHLTQNMWSSIVPRRQGVPRELMVACLAEALSSWRSNGSRSGKGLSPCLYSCRESDPGISGKRNAESAGRSSEEMRFKRTGDTVYLSSSTMVNPQSVKLRV